MDGAKFNELKDKPTAFASGFLRILDKQMNVIPFVHSPVQAHYLRNRSTRDLILKPRQLGFSTAVQGELFRYCVTRPVRVMTIGKDHENTADLRVIFNRFYEQLPDGFRPSRDISNATTTEFKTIGSRAVISTAGNRTSGRGGTNYAIHMSEIAFYRDAAEIIKGATQAGNPRWIVCESTPNGERGWFYERCMDAYYNPDKTAWALHFYEWWKEDTYHAPLVMPAQDYVYSEDEQRLIEQHRLSTAQIQWRRNKIAEIGLSAFVEEYPEDVIECFKRSGGGVFRYLEQVIDAGSETVTPYEGRFVAGLDWGREDDYTALSIWDYETQEEVYLNRWRYPLSYAQIRQRVIDACATWGVRTLWAEGNSMGANIEELENDIQERGLRDKLLLNVFTMTNKRKALLVDWLRNDMERKNVLLLDVDYATREAKAFTESVTPTGLPHYSHPQIDGAHDDTVDARMLAYWATRQAWD